MSTSEDISAQGIGLPIEYRSDDITKKTLFAFQCFGYHVCIGGA